VKNKAKEDKKRSISYNISLKFRLDQRLLDKKTSLSMLDIMEKIAQFLHCSLLTFDTRNNSTKILSVSVTSIKEIKVLINYFDNYPLLGVKNENYKD
jgi:hypothetical protein